MSAPSYLTKFAEDLRERLRPFLIKGKQYSVPSVWIDTEPSKHSFTLVNASEFFLSRLQWIINQPKSSIPKGQGGGWTRDAVIYNMFVRTTCAFDHNQNGSLDLPVNKEGWRETGTFMKALAMLPYIQSLGVNTIHLLPVTAIGADGNKGTLGSPYAIKNPYHLDDHLCEPNLGIGVEEEFKMFVEAAHHLGIRVVLEFVFRTSSKDGDWVKEHPEWFYWIKESVVDRKPGSHDESQYGNPIFTPEELETILTAVEQHKFVDLPPPHQIYSDMFTQPPAKETIHLEGGRYIGLAHNGTRVRIPGAFADWPPDDAQPPWGDVTYFKMYDQPDFNYIAYNTLRMYDERLAAQKNISRSLWETIAEVIPHYQHTFGIDGVMIDMGHALPMELKHDMIRRAREIDPDFAFWDENFSITKKSVEEGYNAVIGYQWSDQHKPEKFKSMLKQFSTDGFALPFFATAESHNTPRAASREGGVMYSRYAWVLSNVIPAVPFLHSGFEIGEQYPINTGLDFTHDDLEKYPSEQLPLFSAYAYNWSNPDSIIPWVRQVSAIRKKYHSIIVDNSRDSFHWIDGHHEYVISFLRGKTQAVLRLLIIANTDMHSSHETSLHVDTGKEDILDLLSDNNIKMHGGTLHISLLAGQVAVFEL